MLLWNKSWKSLQLTIVTILQGYDVWSARLCLLQPLQLYQSAPNFVILYTRSSPALCKQFALQRAWHPAYPGKIASRETANLLCRSGSSTPEQQLAHLATLKVVLLLSLIYLKVQLASPKMVGSQKEFSRLAQALNQGDSTCQTNYLRWVALLSMQ